MLGKLRKQTRSIVISIAKVLAVLPITANQFTLIAIPLAVIAAYFLAKQNYVLGLVFIILTALIDLLDGPFANVKKQKSNFGNYFDAIVDRVVEVIIYFGLVFAYPLLAFLCIVTSMLITYAKTRAGLVIETDNHDWPAIGERSDRLVLLIIGILIANFISSQSIQIVLVVIVIINLIGFIQRVFYAKKLIKKGKVLPYLKKR